MIYIPFIGALSFAGITLMEKLALRKRKVPLKTFHTFTFLASVILMLPIIYFFWNVSSGALELKNLLILFVVIIFSIAANLFSFYALRWEKITNIEPAKMFEHLFTILLAIGFSFLIPELYERNFNVIIPAIIASLALIFPHLKKHHLEFNKYFIAALAGSFCFATELILSRMILEFYSPISFYFLRCSGIFFISFLMFRPSTKTLSKKIKLELLFIGFLWVVFRLAIYYGYLYAGVVMTTLIVMLAPVLIYVFAWKFLKEKLTWKNVLAAAIILGCVVYATLS